MRLTARVFFRCVVIFFIGIFSLFFLKPLVYAQTTLPDTPSDAQQYAMPNADPDVPKNQHTLAQSVLIETLIAIGCQLTGVDLSSPQTPCLGINPKTNKLSYNTTTEQDG